jgi:hypothetical protein
VMPSLRLVFASYPNDLSKFRDCTPTGPSTYLM